MPAEAWITSFIILLVLALLVATRRAPGVILSGGLTALLVFPVPIDSGWKIGVLSIQEGLAGFSNEGVITVAVLYVVAAALRETGGLGWAAGKILGRPKTLIGAQIRLMGPAALMSAFLNNTPLVAMLLPLVDDWAKKCRLSVSKLLIPLSFASILGGACTLIGTSTNLIVNGWLIQETNQPGFGMFEIALVGVPCALVGLIFLLLFSRKLLRDRTPVIDLEEGGRRYTVEMIVVPGSPIAGKTIEAAGLRHLPGLYLMEIDRDDLILPAVSSNIKLNENDRLIFVGVIESVVDLQKIRGLSPATKQVYKLDEPRVSRVLLEAVVSDSCPLVGMSIREGRFRSRYNAAVIAVARQGHRIDSKVGDIVLRPGDTLLLEARASFADQQRNSSYFYLVSKIPDSSPPRFDKAPLAALILALMVASVTSGLLSMLQASMIAAGLMILARCCTATAARRSVDLQILIVIAASLGLGKAMQVSGLAESLGDFLIGLIGQSPTTALAVLFAMTTVLANVVTTKAGAVLMLPIALAASAALGLNFMPFAVAVMIAAATAAATPIGYPTNMMVFGPGGYHFTDYLKVGLPMSLLIGVTSVLIIPVFWPY
jgi:di/tricarboxylate transporter